MGRPKGSKNKTPNELPPVRNKKATKKKVKRGYGRMMSTAGVAAELITIGEEMIAQGKKLHEMGLR
jgi:hypothetical protein